MILYTILPQEAVYQAEAKMFDNQRTTNVQGIPAIVEKDDNDNWRIVRLLSTNPQDFLQQDLMPGAQVKL